MKKAIIALIFALSLPMSASAATLTDAQVNSIIGLLIAFNTDTQTVINVWTALRPATTTVMAQSVTTETKSTPQKTVFTTKVRTPEYLECVRYWNPMICSTTGQ